MEDKTLFDSNISFYSKIFELNMNEKVTFINLSKKILNLLSESEINDLNNPLIQECVYKSAIFCIQSKNGTFKKLLKSEHEKNINNYAIATKIDIQKNFKDIHRISTILRNIKDFLNKLSNSDSEITKYPLEILNDISNLKNFKRKLDEMHNSFFNSSDFSFLFKNLIWNVFICLVNENDLKSSTLDKMKLFFAICQNILFRIPYLFYLKKYGKEMTDISSKINIINEYFKKYMSKDINNEKVSLDIKNFYKKLNIFMNEISLEGEELSNKDKIENIIKKLDDYYCRNILNKLNFDHRILLFNDQNDNKSVKIKNNNYLITCNRELFKEEKESQKLRSISFNIESNPLKKNNINISNEKEASLIMTTYTRVWNLLSWAKGVLKNFDSKNVYISNLQKKYHPNYLTKDEYNKFIPINSYANKYMKELIKLLNKYRINSKFEIDLNQLFIYCISLIIENDAIIFSENFCALLLFNDDFIKASVALSFELTLTIFDITEIELNSIYEQLKLDPYDLWKVVLPSSNNLYHIELKKHLEEIDYQLSIFLLWRSPSVKFKNDLKEFLENENLIKDENERNNVYKLIKYESTQNSAFLCHNKKDFEINFINENFKKNIANKLLFKDCYDYIDNYNKVIGIGILIRKLIIYCITLSRFIFNNFYPENNESKNDMVNPITIDEYIIKESELLIKIILTNYNDIEILWDLHIDQFVLCCIIFALEKYNLFGFSKLSKNNFNLEEENSIVKINKNILHNSYNKSKLPIKQINEDSHIFNHVKIFNKKFISLIDFYNEEFKAKFIKYFNEINKIKIKKNIDYFNIQKDINDLQKMKKPKNSVDDEDDDSDFSEKPKKKLKISDIKYILYTSNNSFNEAENNNIEKNKKFETPLELNKNYDFEESISLLKKLNNKNNNKLNLDLFKDEKYSAYRNDNLKLIYNNIIKFELPPNEENRKTNKCKLSKLKELIKGKKH